MRHPTDGTLRRLLDEPAGVADTDREHIAGCAVCRSALLAAQRDTELVGAALGGPGTAHLSTDVDAGWARLSGALADQAPAERARARPATGRGLRWRRVLGSPVIAAVGAVTLLTGAGAAAAADWLQIFRTEQITPVEISRADLVQLPDLSAFGEIEIIEQPNLRTVADAAAATQATGLSVPQVAELPRGVLGEPIYQVGDRIGAQFVYSAERAAVAAAESGDTLPPTPPGLDGATFRLSAGPGVAAMWTEARGLPALVVARAQAPTAFSTGVPFTVVRDHLLSMPGVSPTVAAQLRAFAGDGTTLPLPVNADELDSTPGDVNGAPATVLTSRDGTMAGVIWVQDGVVTAVAGSLSSDEVLTVARGLR